jgi:putative hydrolase of the HAD superfamily
MLSNTNDGHWTTIEKRFFNASGESLENCFDALYLSYRMHRRKPEKEIFLELMNSEGVTPDECIFYDDSAENCEAARSLGIDAVQLERNSSWGSAFDAF